MAIIPNICFIRFSNNWVASQFQIFHNLKCYSWAVRDKALAEALAVYDKALAEIESNKKMHQVFLRLVG